MARRKLKMTKKAIASRRAYRRRKRRGGALLGRSVPSRARALSYRRKIGDLAPKTKRRQQRIKKRIGKVD